MANSSTPPEDNSKSIIRLLTFLVALLAILLVLCVVGIGGLLFWQLNRNGESNDQIAAQAFDNGDTEPRTEPANVTNDSTREPEVSDSTVAEIETKATESLAPTAEHSGSLPALPTDLAVRKRSEEALRYRLDRKNPVTLDFSNLISIDKVEVRNKGRITYRFLDDDPFEYLRDIMEKDSEDNGQPFSLSGNGTGFLVHPDGLLATCAHVVEGVTEVNVKLGEENYSGSVVAVDSKHDLALVKINANRPMPYLKLATDTPNLGTAARVFGFPLADRLGRSMKLTTGTVTGIDSVNDSRRLQLDATANPGNSGGPVTNNDGSVLGVVDSILAGGQVADMSFAVPVQELQRLLDNHSIAFRRDNETDDELAISSLDETSKAVAMIEISSEQTAKAWKVVDVRVKNRVTTGGGGGIAAMMHRSPFGDTKTTNAKIVLNSRGKLIHCTDSQFLPGIIQNLASIGLMELPSGAHDKWTSDESLLMQTERTERESRQRDPFGFRFGMHPGFRRPPFASPFDRGDEREVTKQTIRSVEISDEFEIQPFRKPILEFRQRRKVVTRDLADRNSRDTTVLRGNTVFDRELGWTESGELEGKLNLTIEGRKKEVDVAYSFRFITEEELEKETTNRKARVAAAKKKAEDKKKVDREKTELLDLLSDGEPGFPGFDFFKPPADLGEVADGQPEKLPRVVTRIPKGRGQGQVAISPEGDLVAVSSGRTLTLHRIDETGSSFKQIAKYDGGTHWVTGSAFLKFSLDGQRLVAGDQIGKVQVLELKGDKLKELAFFKCSKPIAVAPGGHRIAYFSNRKDELVVVDIETQDELMKLSGDLYPGPVHDLVFSANGEELIAAQGNKATLIDIAEQEIKETSHWPFDEAPGETRFAGSGRYIIGNRQAFDVMSGESFRIPIHDDCFSVCGRGTWFVHISKKFDELIQFSRIDGSEKYRIETGAKSGHWSAFDIAVYKNRMVAFEVFSESVVVLEF